MLCITGHAMSTRLQGWIELDVFMRIELARWQGAAPIGHGSFGATHGSIDSIDIGQRQAHLLSSHTIQAETNDAIFRGYNQHKTR